MNYFAGITTLENLRKEYKRLAFENHPDKGGDTEVMKTINSMYEDLSKKLINGNAEFSDGRKWYENSFTDRLRDIINSIVLLPNINIEIIGTWIWVTGETKEVKEDLKKSGFKYSKNKKAWYFYEGSFRKTRNENFSLDEIRSFYGNEEVEKNSNNKRELKDRKKEIS